MTWDYYDIQKEEAEIEDSVEHMVDEIHEMLEDIKPKRISNHQVLLCRELPKYIKEYIILYENTQDSLPKARTILETTEKICQENAKTKTIHYYKTHMSNRLKNMSMTKEDINAWHKECLRESKKYFNKLYIMGEDDSIQIIQKEILKEIENEYDSYLLIARENSIFNYIINYGTNVLRIFNFGFCFMNKSILKFFLLLCFVFYVGTLFFPLCGEIAISCLKYIICLLIGMYVCTCQKENNDDSKFKNTI